MKPPKPPDDLVPRGRGRKFWREVLSTYTLRPDELEQLAEACRILDECDRLRELVAAQGMLDAGSRGQTTVYAAQVELRQSRDQLRKTLASLALPDDPAADAADQPNGRSLQARQAATQRWRRSS
jgi:hypothetical protein